MTGFVCGDCVAKRHDDCREWRRRREDQVMGSAWCDCQHRTNVRECR